MSGQSDNTNSTKSNSKMLIFVVIGIAAIIVLLAVILILVLGGKEQEQPEEKRAVVVTEEKAEEVAQEMIQEEYIEPGYYNVVMTTEWNFKNGESESDDSYVENVTENTNDVYFDIFLAEDEDNAIYNSPVIPRGAKLENIKLDTPLKAGSYKCVMIYHLVDDNQNTVSELRVGLTINIES